MVITISPSTTQPGGQPVEQRLVQLGEVAVERPRVAALDVQVGGAAEDDRAEPVPLGLEEEVAVVGQAGRPAWRAWARSAGRWESLRRRRSWVAVYYRMIVHVLDGTYELFRHFYGQRRFNKGQDKPFGAVTSLLHIGARAWSRRAPLTSVSRPTTSSNPSATSCGPATRPATASSARCSPNSTRWRKRSRRWASWSGRWSSWRRTTRSPRAAHLAALDERVERVCIWANDKDLAQCVRGTHVVQMDRKSYGDPRRGRGEEEVRRGAGADPRLPRAGGRSAGRVPRASTGSARRPRRACSTGTGRSRTFLRRFWGAGARRRCCSRRSPRCERMRRCSGTWTSSSGGGPRRSSRGGWGGWGMDDCWNGRGRRRVALEVVIPRFARDDIAHTIGTVSASTSGATGCRRPPRSIVGRNAVSNPSAGR